jgi:hypothetical protein
MVQRYLLAVQTVMNMVFDGIDAPAFMLHIYLDIINERLVRHNTGLIMITIISILLLGGITASAWAES